MQDLNDELDEDKIKQVYSKDKEKTDWSYYFKKLPIKLSSESDLDYKNRCYTWSKDNFNPPIKKK
jgi:hypothetical protein